MIAHIELSFVGVNGIALCLQYTSRKYMLLVLLCAICWFGQALKDGADI